LQKNTAIPCLPTGRHLAKTIKNKQMKKLIVALALAGGFAVFAYASLHNRNSDKQAIEKQEKKEMKKECKKRCLFS
jgi:hypothetical protein